MKDMNGNWFKTIVWGGTASTVPCTDHAYAWSGSMPCTGMYCCVHCGKPEAATFNGRKPEAYHG